MQCVDARVDRGECLQELFNGLRQLCEVALDLDQHRHRLLDRRHPGA
jgi:hypothetical protein